MADKYRKKPVIVEVVRVPPDTEDAIPLHGKVLGLFFKHHFTDFEVAEDKGYNIIMLEGVMHASPGDYIIRGVKGEFYPCKPDIFEETYERAD